LGDQLFPPDALSNIKVKNVYMAENLELCTHFRYHQQKIVLFLASMRRYAKDLEDRNYIVEYRHLSDPSSKAPFEDGLISFLKKSRCAELHAFEIEDKFLEERITSSAKNAGVALTTHQSPMFLTSRPEFQSYLKDQTRPFMKSFYQFQRRRLNILMDKDGQPTGGRWSFDEDNRKKLPKGVQPPPLPLFKRHKEVGEVIALVEQQFASHPGKASNFWLPTSRSEALQWLDDFLLQRFAAFGDYEDAMSKEHHVLFHSALTPVLNKSQQKAKAKFH
jgi:deoxyribodipyrimidine photolyase-related protein